MAVERKYITYNQVHKLCQASAVRILEEFKPNLMIAYASPFKTGCQGRLFADSPQYWRRRICTCPNSSVSFFKYLPSCYILFILTHSLRSFLKTPGSPNIPIQAIGLSLYEKLVSEDGPEEEPGTKVTRTQWLDFSSLKNTDLIGKNILIVDEVDDTRTTLQYAVQELSKDVEAQAKKLGSTEKTNFYIFVLHVRF